MSLTILAFIVVLGILILVHELGHFLIAKACGVGVERFSLGFGPRLIGKKVGITDYCISAFPIGGYVKMVGEKPDSELSLEEIPLSFSHKNVYKRIMIVAAGPIFNILLSVLIFFSFFVIYGLPVLTTQVGEVRKGMPAHEAGVKAGDRIVSIDGRRLTRWEDMVEVIQNSNGRPLCFEIHRGDNVIYLNVVPRMVHSTNLFGERIEKYIVGISAAGTFVTKRINPWKAIVEGVNQTWKIARLTILSVIKLVKGTLSMKTLGGPIMIAQLAGEQARAGLLNLIFFTALLSVNLAIINLLPIPVLDGGHLLFFLIEAAIRRPLSVKMREIAQQIGIALLIMLMVYVFYNDITRLFTTK